MFRFYLCYGGQIGDSAGDFDDFEIAACGEVERFCGGLE